MRIDGGNATGDRLVAVDQRADTGKGVQNFLWPNANFGKHKSEGLQDIVALIFFTAHVVGVVNFDVCRSHQHIAEIGKQNTDAAILVFVINHLSARRLQQVIISNDQV